MGLARAVFVQYISIAVLVEFGKRLLTGFRLKAQEVASETGRQSTREAAGVSLPPLASDIALTQDSYRLRYSANS